MINHTISEWHEVRVQITYLIVTILHTSTIAPYFSHKKGSRDIVYETVIPIKVNPLRHGLSSYPLLVSFFFQPLRR